MLLFFDFQGVTGDVLPIILFVLCQIVCLSTRVVESQIM